MKANEDHLSDIFLLHGKGTKVLGIVTQLTVDHTGNQVVLFSPSVPCDLLLKEHQSMVTQPCDWSSAKEDTLSRSQSCLYPFHTYLLGSF